MLTVSDRARFAELELWNTRAGLAPADRASFAWRLPLFDHLVGATDARSHLPAYAKTAGSASIVISVCVVASGLLQYWRLGAIETGRGPKRIVSAMSAGSLIGAALGGLAVGFAPVDFVKVVLGAVLIAAAAKVAISLH